MTVISAQEVGADLPLSPRSLLSALGPGAVRLPTGRSVLSNMGELSLLPQSPARTPPPSGPVLTDGAGGTEFRKADLGTPVGRPWPGPGHLQTAVSSLAVRAAGRAGCRLCSLAPGHFPALSPSPMGSGFLCLSWFCWLSLPQGPGL